MGSKKEIPKKRKWTTDDVIKIILLVSIIIFIILVIKNEKDAESNKPPIPTEYYQYEHSSEEIHSVPQSKTVQYPLNTKENNLIDEIDKGDYYDYSDYYDGLDGEYSDIDYNEIRDYFED